MQTRDEHRGTSATSPAPIAAAQAESSDQALVARPWTLDPPAPTDAALRAHCAQHHAGCFACRPVDRGGLGLAFTVQADGSVATEWICPPGGESYTGIVHGGLLATALDSAMVHALFARGIVARTGELTVRYRQSVRVGEPVTVSARHRGANHPLHHLEAELRQAGVLCAHARAKFMAVAVSER